MSEGYRRTCSLSWVGQALAARLMKAEKAWGHGAFFAYVDRWMYEDYTEFAAVIKEVHNVSYSRGANQGQCWEPFVNEMWARYRTTLPAPIDKWQKPRKRSP